MVENSSETDSLPDKLPLSSAGGRDAFESASAKATKNYFYFVIRLKPRFFEI
jgi:hypothetical protein